MQPSRSLFSGDPHPGARRRRRAPLGEPLPSKLYKYVPADRIDILENASVRFTPPAVFNDPFEILPTLVRTYFYRDRAKIGHDQLAFAQDRKHADDIRARTAVLSLTEAPDHLLMWSHYADQHRGFVLEFDARHGFFDQRQADDDEFHHVRKVQYSEYRPSTTIEFFLSPRTLLTKSVEWKYEQEWRMLVDLARFAHRPVSSGGQEIHLVSLPPECITGVILGSRMPEETRARIDDLVAKDPRYAHVTVRCAELDGDKFGLLLRGPGEHYFERAKRFIERAGALLSQAEPVKGERRENPLPLLEAAIADVDRALRFASSEKGYLYLRAVSHQMLGRHFQSASVEALQAAVSDFSRALGAASGPNVLELYWFRGRLLAELGRLEEAEQDLERARPLRNREVGRLLREVKQARAEQSKARASGPATPRQTPAGSHAKPKAPVRKEK